MSETPRDGFRHNPATCSLEAWWNGEKIGEIVDGLEREDYANWYGNLLNLQLKREK